MNQLLSHHSAASTESSASPDSIFWNHFSEGSLMLHLQAAFTSGKVAEGFMSYKALYLLGPFLGGVWAFNKFNQGLEKKNLQPMLDYVEKFLEKNENFSGDDKLGEGDVSTLQILAVAAIVSQATCAQVKPELTHSS